MYTKFLKTFSLFLLLGVCGQSTVLLCMEGPDYNNPEVFDPISWAKTWLKRLTPTSENAQLGEEVDAEISVQQPEIQTDEITEDILSEQPTVAIAWLTKDNAIKFGIGAVALITIGYVTYVLYKNGNLKKAADVIKQHPYIAAGSISAAISLVAGSVVVYKYYSAPSAHTAS